MEGRITAAPRSSRAAAQGAVAMAPHPSRNSGARIRGVYDVPAGTHVHMYGELRSQPHWVDRPGGTWLTWGFPFTGTGSVVAATNQFQQGVTLWTLDADDNPVLAHNVDTLTGLVSQDEFTYGAVLGARGAVTQMWGIQPTSVTRFLQYVPFPGPYSIQPPKFAIRSTRVSGGSLVMGPRYDFTFLSATEPLGAVRPGGSTDIPGVDFMYAFGPIHVAGLRQDRALLISAAAKQGDGAERDWVTVHAFNPFDPEGSLKSPTSPSVARQPDFIYSEASLGLKDTWDFYVSRLSDTEAVAVFTSYNASGVYSDYQVNVVRFSETGAVLGNTVVVYTDLLVFAQLARPSYMGSGVVTDGSLKIHGGVSVIDLPTPTYTGFTVNTSQPLRVDDATYMFVHLDAAANPDELTFTLRDLLTDEDIGLITSYADVDAEVVAIRRFLTEGFIGQVGEGLWATIREPGPYATRNQVVTIGLGGFHGGTAEVITEHKRFHRLSQGRT